MNEHGKDNRVKKGHSVRRSYLMPTTMNLMAMSTMRVRILLRNMFQQMLHSFPNWQGGTIIQLMGGWKEGRHQV